VRFRSESLGLVRTRWLSLSAATLLNQLSVYLALELALRGIGVSRAEVSIAASFAAWSIGRLLTALPLTPGGVGFVELGLTGSLIGFGGPNAKIVAAVLVFRALSVVPIVAAGAVSMATWKLQKPAVEPSP
jgi:putative heme transporter